MPVLEEKDLKIDLYRMMLKIRYFEEKISQLFADGEIPGFFAFGAGTGGHCHRCLKYGVVS
jgi:TPP-dependent pyruvate/acetoin dehydrogenase alpha subunit